MKKTISILLCILMLTSGYLGAYAKTFTDVDDSLSWAMESITKFFDKKIIEGRGDGKFAPNESVTRAEFAKMLALTFELNDKNEILYSDVKDGTWEHEYISLANEYTVMANVLDNNADKDKYMPNKNASRQEIAYSLALVLDIKADDDYLGKNFTDSDKVNKQLYNNVNAIAKEGLIKGYEDNSLRPEGDVTRAEAIVLLDRALKYKTEHDKKEPLPSASSSPAPTPKSSQDIFSVVDTLVTSIEGNEYYYIYYDFRGVRAKEPLIVRADLPVSGLKNKVSDITCGDVIMYSLQVKDNINAIRVLFSMGRYAPTPETTLDATISLPSGLGLGFYNSNEPHKIYYGKVKKIRQTNAGLAVTLQYNNNLDQVFLLSDADLGITLYKPYIKNIEKRFKMIDMSAIKAAGNNSGAYMLVKTKRDTVADVIVIDHNGYYK